MARLKSGMHETRGHAKETPEATLSLTTRQKEVLHLVALGHTNREIGGQLGISVRTVEVHRFNLMRRLRVRNVAQLIRQGMLLQLIPKQPPPPESTTPPTKAKEHILGQSSRNRPRHSANER